MPHPRTDRSRPVSGAPPSSAALRQHNAAAVWAALDGTDGLTGTELMAACSLSRPTVHAVCDDLIARGLVVEIETRSPHSDTGAGRPARQYASRDDGAHVVGIDLGAKKVSAVVADLRGRVRARESTSFRDERVPAVERITIVRETVRAALAAARVDSHGVLCVAMGVPSPVDARGHVTAAEHYLPGLAELDLRAVLADDFGWTTIVENDANLAVIGERWLGVAQGVEDVVELLAGYRLGAGVVLGGRLLRGSGGAAGELTFLNLVEGVGNTDAVAELAEVLAHEAETDGRFPAMEQLGPDARDERGRPRARAVFDAARRGDPVAHEIVDRIVDRMARVVAIISTFLNPSLVVIGGGAALVGDLILPPLRSALPALTDTPPQLEASSLGDHAVTTGAVRCALDDVETRLFGDTPALTLATHSALPSEGLPAR